MKKQEELVLNKKYTFGKKVFFFLMLKNGLKPFLWFILFCSIVYLINTDVFFHWWSGFNTIVTVGMLNLWFISLLLSIIILIFVSAFEMHIQHKFLLGEHSFHIRRGIFMVKEKVIPYRHIQNVDIDRPYHYRLFGLSKLDITTSRLDNFEDEKTNLIPLIDKNLANKLSDFLIKQGVISHSGNIIKNEKEISE
jgi:membrane protein YdbS with pleckstrin-like domain